MLIFSAAIYSQLLGIGIFFWSLKKFSQNWKYSGSQYNYQLVLALGIQGHWRITTENPQMLCHCWNFYLQALVIWFMTRILLKENYVSSCTHALFHTKWLTWNASCQVTVTVARARFCISWPHFHCGSIMKPQLRLRIVA